MSDLKIYAWFDPSLAGFVCVGTENDRPIRLRNKVLEFNDCAAHFEVRASPARADYMRQVSAIAQIAAIASSDEKFRKRCMKDVSALKEVATTVPIEILGANRP